MAIYLTDDNGELHKIAGSSGGSGTDANAEHCELVYDKETKPVPLGSTTAYNTGIWGTVNMDLSKYKFIRAYFGHNNKQYTMIINCDIGFNGSGFQMAEDTNLLATLISCTTTSFTLNKNGYYTVPSMSFNNRTYGSGSWVPENYIIYRIEGVY